MNSIKPTKSDKLLVAPSKHFMTKEEHLKRRKKNNVARALKNLQRYNTWTSGDHARHNNGAWVRWDSIQPIIDLLTE